MLDIYLIKLPTKIHNFSRLLNVVDLEKKEKIRSFVRISDSYRTLISDLLVRYILSKRLHVSYNDLTFGLGEFGKPFCSSHHVHYNISHSGDWIVMAVGEFGIGIDIEKVNRCDFDDIVLTFFSSMEIQHYLRTPAAERKETFFEIWTLKESFVKNMGLGLNVPLDRFSIWKYKEEIYVKQDFDDNEYYFKQYDAVANYKLSVCYRDDAFPKECQLNEVNMGLLENFFV